MTELNPDSAAFTFDTVADRYEVVTGGCSRAMAQYVVSLPRFTSSLPSPSEPDALILDNACGTGFVSEEILRRYPSAHIEAVDVAPNMIQLASARFHASSNVQFQVMPGEKLDFPDNSFTHSITNLGVLFFSSPSDGVKEIYRTLKPGGMAIITSWSRLGTVQDAIAPAQKQLRPDDAPIKLSFPGSVPEEWFDKNYIESFMRYTAGFQRVEMLEHAVYYGAPSLDALCELVFDSFKEVLWETWPEEEQEKLRQLVYENIRNKSKRYTMPSGKPGVGLPMDGIIAICWK